MKQCSSGPLRTQGDGMENNFSPEKLVGYKNQNFHYDQVPKGTVIGLIPAPLTRPNNTTYNSYRKKEPKLILYEPYKAAVKPILPQTHKGNISKEKKTVKNNLDCNELVSQVLFMSTNELNLQKGIPMTDMKVHERVKVNNVHIPILDTEKQNLMHEINCLRDQNSVLQSQLTFQVQVNSELKSMLVAAVGEDIQTRVHLLTEDKMHLAEALLKSVDNLSTHQEQIEWLAGQCEVWRSKFLACSLMVEELAKSKHVLSQRVNDLVGSMKGLLNEMHEVRDKQCLTLRNLNRTIHGTTSVIVSDLLDINEMCYQLSELLNEHKFGKNECTNATGYALNLKNTPVQARAEKLLKNSLLIQGSDLICKAVVSSANCISK